MQGLFGQWANQGEREKVIRDENTEVPNEDHQ